MKISVTRKKNIDLIADVSCEREEDVSPAIDLILLDDFVHHLPRRLPQHHEQDHLTIFKKLIENLSLL